MAQGHVGRRFLPASGRLPNGGSLAVAAPAATFELPKLTIFSRLAGSFTMSWITNTLTSSIGRKIIMALTGLFLCSFLVIHLSGNLQLFKHDNGLAFNAYSEFMSHNTIIRILEWGLVLGFGGHIVQGLVLYFKNRSARSVGYVVNHSEQNSSWTSRSMALLGTIILFFLVVHLYNFFGQLRYTDVAVDANGNENAYALVVSSFKNPWYVALYVVAQLALLYHLVHGFASAFHTLGLNHRKYTPLIKAVGYGFSVVVAAGFASFPLYFLLFTDANGELVGSAPQAIQSLMLAFR